MGRQFKQQAPAYTGETFLVSMQGTICPSPDFRTWDFTQDPRAQDALTALLTGLLSEGKQTGKNCLGCLCAFRGLPASCIGSAGCRQGVRVWPCAARNGVFSPACCPPAKLST